MSNVSDFFEEERSLFCPFTRESLAAIEARIADEYAKQKEAEDKKRVEGEIRYDYEVEPVPCIFKVGEWLKNKTSSSSAAKVMVRGFILQPCTYFRDAWNCLNFVIIVLSYVTMGVDLGNLPALRLFRVLCALKTVAIVPSLKTIVGAVIESVTNLCDVINLTVMFINICAHGFTNLYGSINAECIRQFPTGSGVLSQMKIGKDLLKTILIGLVQKMIIHYAETLQEQERLMRDIFVYKVMEIFRSQLHKFLFAFRLMTQDIWKNLYQQAIVAMSYNELQKKAKEEEAAIKEAEEVARVNRWTPELLPRACWIGGVGG
ncbi:hypothetical protein FQA39_LY04048 [Lamprigera yunnana]|nr:hypothetical protein FQA39_LY04048 [Lamprigera yunnana]